MVITVIDGTALTAAIVSPVNNSKLSGQSINVQADASLKYGTVKKVSLVAQDSKGKTTSLGTFAAKPYTYSWKNVLPGSYKLKADATDNYGKVVSSPVVSVTVTK